jgi:hypothetical protein
VATRVRVFAWCSSVGLFLCMLLCAGAGAQASSVGTEAERANGMKEQSSSTIGKKFPTVSAATLAGGREVIPDSAFGKVTLVTVAFLRENQGQLDSWLNPFAEAFGSREGFMFYEVPMISSGYKFMKFIIDGGMRAGLPKSKHRHVVTMYGDVESYTSALQLDPRYGYAFLLDQEGIIRWQAQGYATPQTRQDMLRTAEQLAR